MVKTTLKRLVSPCWKHSVEDGENSGRGDSSGRVNGLLWYKDSGHHVNGKFSMAVIQANNLLEDQSQLESGPMGLMDSGPQGTFVGVYDGHAGPETSRFINNRLFENIKSMLLFHFDNRVFILMQGSFCDSIGCLYVLCLCF